MQYITRLLMRAKKIAAGEGKYILGFVDYDIEKKLFTASGSIWDGVPGSGGEPFYSEHSTQEEAVAACEAVAAKYPGCENINFIIDDLSFPEGE